MKFGARCSTALRGCVAFASAIVNSGGDGGAGCPAGEPAFRRALQLKTSSGEKFLHHPSRILIRNPLPASLALKNQIAMIHTKSVQDSCMEIVYTHTVFDSLVANLVSGAIHRPALSKRTA